MRTVQLYWFDQSFGDDFDEVQRADARVLPNCIMDEKKVSASETVLQAAQRIHALRMTEVAPYVDLYPLLLAEVPEIMVSWDRQTQELPWSAIAATERQNNLVSVITRVIDCALSDATRDSRVAGVIAAACAHGESRRAQGMPVDALFREYDLLRSATWSQLSGIAGSPTSYGAIFVIDGLLSVATRATVLGYHRSEMLANGLWETHLEELKKTVRS